MADSQLKVKMQLELSPFLRFGMRESVKVTLDTHTMFGDSTRCTCGEEMSYLEWVDHIADELEAML